MEKYIEKAIKQLNLQIGEFYFELNYKSKIKALGVLEIEINLTDPTLDELYTITFDAIDNNSITIKLMQVLSEIEEMVYDRLASKSELFFVTEYDVWMSNASKDFKGIFDSKIKAIFETQKYYKTIIIEESNGQFVDIANCEEFYLDKKFDKISITEIVLNKLN